MKVTVNAPKPVEPPPTTYNVELSENEFLALRSLISRRDLTSVKTLEQLRLQMWGATQGKISPFRVEPSQRAVGAYHIRLKTDLELKEAIRPAGRRRF